MMLEMALAAAEVQEARPADDPLWANVLPYHFSHTIVPACDLWL